MDAAPDLPAARAHPPAPAQAHSHDHPLSTETDIDDGRPGQAEHPVESGTDAHVVLLRKPLVLNSQQPAAEDGGASPAFCATSERNLRREVPAQTDKAARGSPPNNEKTRKYLMEDTTGMGSAVLASDLDWTLVRTPRVVHGHSNGACRTGILELGPWSKVTRGTAASFMLRCLADSTYVRRAPMVSD